MNKLAKILKEQRESLGLSQQELDKKAGMPKGSVSHLESGDYRQLNSQQKQLVDSMIQQMRSQP